MSQVQTLYYQACQSLHEGDLAVAEQHLQELLALPAEGSSGRFLPDLDSFLGQVTLGRYPQTEWNLNFHDLARFLLSQIHWEQGNAQAALQGLQELLDASPSAEGYHQLARWLIVLDRRDPAAVALGLALQQDPAYLPAYEDLVMLANLNGDSDLAFALIQQAQVYELTPRLFQELLLACSREDFVPQRGLFLELCVRSLRPETRPLLVPLLQRLYDEGDFHHAAYLGYHLLQAFPLERQILSLYVLAALKLERYAPALQALLQAADLHFRQGEHWFKLGVAYSLWRMPAFAQHAFVRAKTLTPGLESACAPWLARLVVDPGTDALLAQILRQMMLQPLFATQLRFDPAATLKAWDLPLSEELLEAVSRISPPASGGPEAAATTPPGTGGEE